MKTNLDIIHVNTHIFPAQNSLKKKPEMIASSHSVLSLPKLFPSSSHGSNSFDPLYITYLPLRRLRSSVNCVVREHSSQSQHRSQSWDSINNRSILRCHYSFKLRSYNTCSSSRIDKCSCGFVISDVQQDSGAKVICFIIFLHSVLTFRR